MGREANLFFVCGLDPNMSHRSEMFQVGSDHYFILLDFWESDFFSPPDDWGGRCVRWVCPAGVICPPPPPPLHVLGRICQSLLGIVSDGDVVLVAMQNAHLTICFESSFLSFYHQPSYIHQKKLSNEVQQESQGPAFHMRKGYYLYRLSLTWLPMLGYCCLY